MHLPSGVCHENMETTALSLAIEGGRPDMVNCLLELGYPFLHSQDTDGIPGSYYLSLACARSILRKSENGVKVVTVLLRYLYSRLETKLIDNGIQESELEKNTLIYLCLIVELECKPVNSQGEVNNNNNNIFHYYFVFSPHLTD